MYTVVQFIENQKFKVMAVPAAWVKRNVLLWPKLSNAKIESLRLAGHEFNGPKKKIPVIVCNSFKNIQLAEEAAEELSKREVSDIDNKRKRLKPAKKPKALAPKDYNKMIQACNLQNTSFQSIPIQLKVDNASEDSRNLIHTMENFVAADLSIPMNTNANVIVLNEPYSSSQTVCPRASMAYDENCEPTITQQTTSQKIQNVSLVQHAKPSVNSHMIEATLIHPQASALLPVQHNTNSCTLTSQVNQIHVPADQLPTSSKIIRGTSPEQTVLGDGKGYLQDENMFYQYADENNTSALQITGSMSYEQMKADLKVFIETTVTKSVEKAFETNFARYAALSDIEARENSAKSEDDIVENHTLINNEDELSKWNIKLNSRHLRQRFLEYFSKIIIPNAYIQKGDNACYTVVDCLFTRDFWTKMTWTGISRGNKAKRGFREYGNVIQLLGDIVRIGDPSYTAQKLELFCRNKLFRYCKPRSTCQKLRKSACRPKRSRKAAAMSAGDGHNTDHEDPPSSDDDERMVGDESNFESDDEECDGNTSMDSD